MTHRERFSGALALAESLISEELEKRAKPATLDDSFSLMAHDLRGPLTAAKLGIEATLKRPADAATVKKILPRAIAALDRGNRMIQNWLDAYALRSGRELPLRFERCELGALAHRVIESLHPEDAARCLVDASAGPVEGIWDAEALRRCLENLIGNALKYGDPVAPVTVTVAESGDRAELRVHNHGNELTTEDLERIFLRFSRLPNARSATTSGWGLGLSLVQAVAEGHGGGVTVESQPGSGTCFVVALPRQTAPQPLTGGPAIGSPDSSDSQMR